MNRHQSRIRDEEALVDMPSVCVGQPCRKHLFLCLRNVLWASFYRVEVVRKAVFAMNTDTPAICGPENEVAYLS